MFPLPKANTGTQLLAFKILLFHSPFVDPLTTSCAARSEDQRGGRKDKGMGKLSLGGVAFVLILERG